MLLAAQQTLPSRAFKEERARRWVPEERRVGAAGLVTLPGVTKTDRKSGCRARGRAHLPIPAQGCARGPRLGVGSPFRVGRAAPGHSERSFSPGKRPVAAPAPPEGSGEKRGGSRGR